jgi:hypothetical protein
MAEVVMHLRSFDLSEAAGQDGPERVVMTR